MSELDWYRNRLADVDLLAKAEEVNFYDTDSDGEEFEYFVVAIPVGGPRRGGCLSLSEADNVQQAIDQLSLWDGFPNLRAEYSDDDEVCHVVRWGDDPPPIPDMSADDAAWEAFDIANGRFYGYSEDAIQRYIAGERE